MKSSKKDILKDIIKEMKPYKVTRVKSGAWTNSPSMQKKYDDGLKRLQETNLPEEIRKRIKK